MPRVKRRGAQDDEVRAGWLTGHGCGLVGTSDLHKYLGGIACMGTRWGDACQNVHTLSHTTTVPCLSLLQARWLCFTRLMGTPCSESQACRAVFVVCMA